MRFASDFSYDTLGDLADITYPDCAAGACGTTPPARTVRNSYTDGLLTGVGTPGDPNQYASISYHPNVTIAEIVHGNGVRDVLAEDPTGLPRPAGVEVRTGTSAGVGTLWQAGYSYDGTGNLVTRTTVEKNNTGTTLYNQQDTFRYDNVFNRLASATVYYPYGPAGQADTRAYSYDPYGNLTAVTGPHPRTLATAPATNRLRSPFTYDPAGNLTSQPQWDAAGNPTSSTAWYYTYDAFNKMTRATNAAGTVTRQYLYTADGERLATLSPGRELWTLRGPGNQVLRDLEHLSTGWNWVEDYVYRGSGLLASVSNATGERHYHLDHLGSPRLVTDSGQQVVARHVLAPYGEELTSENQDELRLKFTGHERDELDLGGQEGDLDYMHARFCSSQIGRFSTIDPGRDADPTAPQTWNSYAYAAGNPVKYVDPTGMYDTNCAADDPQCNDNAKAFEAQRQELLKSKKYHDYAAVYGEPGDGNGITVRFEGTGGGTTPAPVPIESTHRFKFEASVRIQPGQKPEDLRAQVGHEGFHLLKDKALVASATWGDSINADQSLNILVRTGEEMAYRITNEILVDAGVKTNFCADPLRCYLGRGVRNPAASIAKILRANYKPDDLAKVLIPYFQ